VGIRTVDSGMFGIVVLVGASVGIRTVDSGMFGIVVLLLISFFFI
jgi:hypothetical protein